MKDKDSGQKKSKSAPHASGRRARKMSGFYFSIIIKRAAERRAARHAAYQLWLARRRTARQDGTRPLTGRAARRAGMVRTTHVATDVVAAS